MQKLYGSRDFNSEEHGGVEHKIATNLHSIEDYEGEFPDFDRNALVNYAKKVVEATAEIRENNSLLKLNEYRRYYSSKYFAKLRDEIELYAANHLIWEYNNIEFFSIVPLGWMNDRGTDTMLLRVKYFCSRYLYDEKNGKYLSGSPGQREKIETILSFQHSDEEKTGSEKMICPNCGAEVSVRKQGKCSFCGTMLYSNVFDWVLCGEKETTVIYLDGTEQEVAVYE